MPGLIRFPLTSFGIATVVLLLSASSPRAQGDDEGEFDRTPRKCLSTSMIRHTDILDDRTILFYMRGKNHVYRTYLPRQCPGLERSDRFAYHVQNSQLCSVDMITVLEEVGTSLTPTFTCRLGEFIPITQEEAEDLKLEDEDQPLKRNAIRAERAEVPPDGGAAQAAPADESGVEQAPPAQPPAAAPRKRGQRGSGVTVR